MTETENLKAGQAAERIAALEAENAALQEELARRADILLAYEQEIDDLNHAVAKLSASRQKVRDDMRAVETPMERRKTKTTPRWRYAALEMERLLHGRSIKLTAPLRRLKFLVFGR